MIILAPPRPAKPFLKWPGGKGRLWPKYAPHFPARYGTYFEPFIGGGAVFFALQPRRAVLSDLNEDLINCYEMVRDHVDALIAKLAEYDELHGEWDHMWYYAAREPHVATLPPLVRAARLIYLNHTCFNGLYRVGQRSGQFNVPMGRYEHPVICDRDGLLRASEALQGVTLLHTNFTHVIARAQCGDLVYCDPPYMPASATANFTSYTNTAFDAMQHYKLWMVGNKLTHRGVHVLMSHSAVPFIEELYHRSDGVNWRLHPIMAARAINRDGSRRGAVREYLVTQ